MNIEIVEFYPSFRDDTKGILRGSLHIYLCDQKIDLRGIYLTKRKNAWFFRLPHQWTIDLKTGDKVFYPVISFLDADKNVALMDALHQIAKKYIQSYVSDNIQQKCS